MKTSFVFVFKTSSRRFEGVFKTSSKPLQDLFKASSRRLQDVLKTSSRYLQDIFKTSCKDIFKTFSRHTIPFLTNLWSVYKICERDIKLSSFSFSLYYTFSWLLTEAYLEPGRTSAMAFFCGNT